MASTKEFPTKELPRFLMLVTFELAMSDDTKTFTSLVTSIKTRVFMNSHTSPGEGRGIL